MLSRFTGGSIVNELVHVSPFSVGAGCVAGGQVKGGGERQTLHIMFAGFIRGRRGCRLLVDAPSASSAPGVEGEGAPSEGSNPPPAWKTRGRARVANAPTFLASRDARRRHRRTCPPAFDEAPPAPGSALSMIVTSGTLPDSALLFRSSW